MDELEQTDSQTKPADEKTQSYTPEKPHHDVSLFPLDSPHLSTRRRQPKARIASFVNISIANSGGKNIIMEKVTVTKMRDRIITMKAKKNMCLTRLFLLLPIFGLRNSGKKFMV